jgi:hypothetical protein
MKKHGKKEHARESSMKKQPVMHDVEGLPAHERVKVLARTAIRSARAHEMTLKQQIDLIERIPYRAQHDLMLRIALAAARTKLRSVAAEVVRLTSIHGDVDA